MFKKSFRILAMVMVVVMVMGLCGIGTASAAPTLYKVTGGGVKDWSIYGIGDVTFGFSAIQVDNSGNAKGQWQVNMHGAYAGLMYHAEILYLSVNTATGEAWLGIKVTESNMASVPVGLERVYRVQDNGEGSKASGPDMISWSWNTSASNALFQVPLTLYAWTNGNIQVYTGSLTPTGKGAPNPSHYKEGGVGSSNSAFTRFYEFAPGGVVIRDGAWGKMKFNLAGPTFDFVFNGHGLEPNTFYMLLVPFHVPPPPTPYTMIASGTTDNGGNINLAGSFNLNRDLAGTHALLWHSSTEYIMAPSAANGHGVTYDDTDIP